MDFAEKVAGDATGVTQEDVDRLREHGLSDADITDVVLAAAGALLHDKVVDALGALPDHAYAERARTGAARGADRGAPDRGG
jgi:alkylhydroperoxidase family enzyme